MGDLCDGINGLWYLAEGDNLNAGLSFSAMIPIAGIAAIGAKWGIKAIKGAKYGERIVEATSKVVRGAKNTGGRIIQAIEKRISRILAGKTEAIRLGRKSASKETVSTAKIKYPPNNGAVSGTESIRNMNVGEEFGRIGSDKGTYVAPRGTSSEQLSLPPNSNTSIYNEYRVVKEIPEVQQAQVAPWFNQPGGGTQFKLPMSIEDLLKGGYIEKITK